MRKPFLVVLVSDDEKTVQGVREALATGDEEVTLQHIERPRTAAARIAGGGVAGVLLDIGSAAGAGALREAFVLLRAAAPNVPLIVLCEANEEEAGKRMVEEGAAALLVRSNWQNELKRRVLSEIAAPQPKPIRGSITRGTKGTIVTFLGAKGGVGATTVAMNVASVLAPTSRVILAELRPPFGSLCYFFRPHRGTRSLHNLLTMNGAQIESADVESCLWPNRSIPGLSVLFAPEKPDGTAEIGSDHADEILRHLRALSDIVIVDLPASLSDTIRTILHASDTLALVVERDALSVDAAKTKLSALEGSGVVPQEAGLVIVNRVALASPVAVADIESQLGLPAFGIVPPAADLCAAAYRVHEPVVKLDPQSSLATSFVKLAHRLAGRG